MLTALAATELARTLRRVDDDGIDDIGDMSSLHLEGTSLGPAVLRQPTCDVIALSTIQRSAEANHTNV
jgi:hypothetical protein